MVSLSPRRWCHEFSCSSRRAGAELPVLLPQTLRSSSGASSLYSHTSSSAFLCQADMKMTYSELSVIGRLRKISVCGPFSMFCKLIHQWKDVLSPVEVSVLLLRCCGFRMFL